MLKQVFVRRRKRLEMRVFVIFEASRASEMAFSLETSSQNGFLAPSSEQLGHLRATWAHLQAILGDLGAILAHLGVILGHIGAILARFGPFQASLGGPENDDFARDVLQNGIFASSWRVLGHLEATCAQHGTILGHIGAILAILRVSWGHLGGSKIAFSHEKCAENWKVTMCTR